jgi:hypothetical protein
MFMFDKAIIRTIALNSLAKLDRDSVSFHGRWSFESTLSLGQTFHTSTTTGDRASTIFNGESRYYFRYTLDELIISPGTTFILQGMTNSNAANYSVTLDGITSSLSAQSSFTVANTTLFFATGLNDSVLHSVEVTNNGGKLSLLENGFWVIAGFSGYLFLLFWSTNHLS